MKKIFVILMVLVGMLASVASAQMVQTCGGAPCGVYPAYQGVPGPYLRGNGFGGYGFGISAGIQTGYPIGGYGGYGGYGYGFAPRNTGVMGAAVNNKLQVIIWNTLPEKVEVFWNNDRVQVDPGDRKTKNINGGNPWAVFLGASNYFPEDWLTEKMVGVRVVGNKGEPTFKQVTSIVPNWSSYSRRSITLVVRRDEDGGLTIKSVNAE